MLEESGTPLIMVLGHKQCGVVKAAIEAMATGEPTHSHFDNLIDAIRPAVERVANRPGDPTDNVVRANVELVVEQLRLSEPKLAGLVSASELTIVGALYDPGTHEVELIVT